MMKRWIVIVFMMTSCEYESRDKINLPTLDSDSQFYYVYHDRQDIKAGYWELRRIPITDTSNK